MRMVAVQDMEAQMTQGFSYSTRQTFYLDGERTFNVHIAEQTFHSSNSRSALISVWRRGPILESVLTLPNTTGWRQLMQVAVQLGRGPFATIVA